MKEQKGEHNEWGTEDEIEFLKGLEEKGINKIRDYFHTIHLRFNWGKIKKKKIISFCVKVI